MIELFPTIARLDRRLVFSYVKDQILMLLKFTEILAETLPGFKSQASCHKQAYRCNQYNMPWCDSVVHFTCSLDFWMHDAGK